MATTTQRKIPARKSKRKTPRATTTEPRKAGAKSKLTPELQARMVELLGMGTGRMRASRAAGIHPATFFEWLKEGEAALSGPKREFSEAVRSAEDDYHEELVRGLKKLALESESESIRLAAINRILERRYPEDWGARQEVRHQGPTGGAVQVEDVTVRVDPLTDRLAALDPEKLDALLSKVE